MLDIDHEIRATNFYGNTRTGRPYVTSQLVYLNATGKQRIVDISYPFAMLDQIVHNLQTIRNENEEYFENN